VNEEAKEQWRCLETACPSGGQWQPASDAAAAWVEHYRTTHQVALADPLDVAADLRSAP